MAEAKKEASEFFKLALAQIPAFLGDFVRLLAHPRVFAKDRIASGRGSLPASLSFLAISILLTAVLKASVFDQQADVTTIYLAKDAIWKAFLVFAMAAVISVSWRFAGGRATFDEYVIANCYFFGVFSVLLHVALLVGKNALGRIGSLPVETFLGFYGVTLLPLSLWGLCCWWAYADLNAAPVKRAVLALVLVAILSIPGLALTYGLRFSLVGHVYRDWF